MAYEHTIAGTSNGGPIAYGWRIMQCIDRSNGSDITINIGRGVRQNDVYLVVNECVVKIHNMFIQYGATKNLPKINIIKQ